MSAAFASMAGAMPDGLFASIQEQLQPWGPSLFAAGVGAIAGYAAHASLLVLAVD